MSKRVVTLIAACLAVAVACPSVADADVVTLLGFAEQYVAPDGGTCTHRGIDIAMQPGEAVDAPVAGSVSFAGRIPGPHGGTVLAVTIDDGSRRLTMMPLKSVAVAAGDRVSEGGRIGEVAEMGDPSSAQTHLHAGLRKGDVYVDPSGLFTAVSAQSADPAPGDATVVNEAEGDVPAAASVAPAPAVVTADAPSVAAVGTGPGVPVTMADGCPASAPAADGELASGVSLAPEAGGRVVEVDHDGRPATRTAATQLAQPMAHRILTGARAVADAPMGIAGCLAAMMACFMLFARRALARRLVSEEPMSHRWGSMLRALRAG